MSDNIFGDLDIASAADDPFAVTDGTYYATLTKCSKEESSRGSKGLTFEYTIHDAEDEQMDGRKISEWKTIPEADDENAALHMSFIKQRLKSLGVPESEMNTVKPDELIGLEVIVTVATKKSKKDDQEYQNVTKMRLNTDDAEGDSSWG
jgi:hypothetical protein